MILGFLPAVDARVVEASAGGIVGNTTLMVNFPDCGDSIATLQGAEDIDVAIHLKSDVGAPVLTADRIPTLVDTRDNSSTSRDFSVGSDRASTGALQGFRLLPADAIRPGRDVETVSETPSPDRLAREPKVSGYSASAAMTWWVRFAHIMLAGPHLIRKIA